MKVVFKIAMGLMNVLYAFMKIRPTRKKILFMSRQSDEQSLDISLLVEEIERSHPDYEVVVLCKKIGKGTRGKLAYCRHMLTQANHLSTSRVVILDSYAILISCLRHRKSLKVIQMWHSVGTMKKFGYSILDKPEGSSSEIAKLMHMHKGYDYILAGSENYKDHLAEGFNQPKSKILTMPLPRVEMLKSKEIGDYLRKKIYSTYPHLDPKVTFKKNIVYCPTFRKDSGDGRENEMFRRAVSALATKIDTSKYNFIVKAHPLTDDIVNVGMKAREFSTFEMLFTADIVISDYSCVIYEAAILGKPLFFFDYDYEEYMQTRDIYMDYENEVPSKICKTVDELIEEMEKPYDMKRLKAFCDKYVTPDSSQETKTIVEFAIGLAEGKEGK